jgi:hypothetical protein
VTGQADGGARCLDPRRREELRRRFRRGDTGPGAYGRWPSALDDIVVGEDGRTLTVQFVGKAPAQLAERHVLIEGGRRIRGIRVVDLEVRRPPDPRQSDTMTVLLDRQGDLSTYTLRMVRPDAADGTVRPHPAFDPRLDRLEFRFRVDCPNPLDCRTPDVCPPPKLQPPAISYLAKDYASFRQLILDRLAVVMPDWTERHVPDLGIVLVELLAYLGDELSYFQDAVAAEAYLDTARRRTSVRRHARLVDYRMHDGCNARTWVCLSTEDDRTLLPNDFFFVTSLPDRAPDGRVLRQDHPALGHGGYEVFEPLVRRPREPLRLRQAHNKINFHTWGERQCCLPEGTTAATLLDRWTQPADPDARKPGRALRLCPGDVLVFEEVRGARTGLPADADPSRRHAVRLTSVRPTQDRRSFRRWRGRRLGRAVVEIEWAREDALPFPLCLSALDPDCRLIEHVSVARGNVVLADHGRTLVQPEELGTVQPLEEPTHCLGEGRPAEAPLRSAPFRARLARGPLTFRQLLPEEPPGRATAAARLLDQEPRQADAQVWLGTGVDQTGRLEPLWTARSDLLGSSGDDRHVAVEVDDEGRAELRFGDGRLGRRPEIGDAFKALYRVGNGRAGNVGAGTITQVVLRPNATTVIGTRLWARNPIAATGGTEPETIAEVKLLAPHAFRAGLARAVTPADYAELARAVSGVQRASASIRWTGAWTEVQVAVDALGATEPPPWLLDEVERHLQPYRRLGHDLRVLAATLVPVDVGLTVCVLPSYLQAQVQAELTDVFSNRDLPGNRQGFFHPDNLTFGGGIRLSQLVAEARSVNGVESVTVDRLERHDEGPAGERQQGILPLGPLEVARVDSDPNLPEHGTVRLTMRGGR